MVAHAEDLARLIVLENGKALVDARGEVKYAASYLQWYAGEALRMYGRVIPSSLPGSRNFTMLSVSPKMARARSPD
jgi:succinate-semialdehyde dehydrogenase / glutarate-semialdehyde dehydrogenase